MNNVFSFNLKYRKDIPEYNQWKNKNQHPNYLIIKADENKLKQKAKAITEPLLLLDNYVHEKAEDSETFFQTYNIELMSITTALCSLPFIATKTIPFLNKHSNKSKIIKNSADLLTKYKNKSFNVVGKNIPLTKAVSAIAIGLGALFYTNGIKKSMESQLGLIRKASYDASKNIIDNHNLFAVLTSEQEKEVNSKVNIQNSIKSDAIDKLKDRIDLKSSFQSVNDYKKNKKIFEDEKTQYLKDTQASIKPAKTLNEKQQVEKDNLLFTNLLKNVEHDVLDPLERVEKISNISYSALFTGGFLEYLLTDKLVDVLHVKNKVLSCLIKIGAPLLTYLLLNKNISDFENKAILATKYKHLKKFSENPMTYMDNKTKEKESLPQFIKNVFKDMKEYDKFCENELEPLKEKMEAKKNLKLTPEQLKDAEILQKNTSYIVNNHKENLYNETVGIESLSEVASNTVDIVATAAGAKLGNCMAKKCNNPKMKGVLTALGAIIGFIPAAITEAKFTQQQKIAEKIAAMKSVKDLETSSLFYNPEEINNYKTFTSKTNILSNFSKT